MPRRDNRRFPVTLEEHDGIHVLRDDLIGGTKMTYVHRIIEENPADGYLFATPPEGGYQLALARACKELGRECVIVTGKRKEQHAHTKRVVEMGATLVEVEVQPRQSHLEAVGRRYVEEHRNVYKVEFGANYRFGVMALASRMRTVTKKLGFEPTTIACAVGSATLLRGILHGTKSANVVGVLIGKEHKLEEFSEFAGRVSLVRHRLAFNKPLVLADMPFPSNPTYETKAWETLRSLLSTVRDKRIRVEPLFWNVLD